MKTPRHGCGWVCGRAVGTALIVLLSSLSLPAQVTNYYVDEAVGKNSYNGFSDVVAGGEEGPKFNVSAAISVATDGSAIQVDTGEYSETLWDSGANSLTLNPQNDVNICGADLCETDTLNDGIPDWWRLEYFGTPTTTNADSCASCTSTNPWAHGLTNLQVYQNPSVLIANNYSTLNDGIPDWWRVMYFSASTTTNAASCAVCDPDGDGYSNLQEYQAGTDPTNYASQPPNNMPAAACFTNLYGIYGTNFISIAPWTSQGIFYQGDSVVISNRIGTTVEVYDFHGNSVTNAAPPVTLMNLKMGHYFVQVDGNATSSGFGDRSQFSVWPMGYTNYPHADIGEPITFTVAMSNRFVRVAPGFQRLAGYWSIICSNSAHTNDFTIFDEYLHGGTTPTQITSCPAPWPNPPVSLKVLDFFAEHYDMASSNYNYGYGSPYVDQTNSLTSFINDFSLFCSNVAVRYTNAFTYEILNEPSGSSMNFTNSYQDPYNSGGIYPSSLAVSAAVQAIQAACPTCQTWAPATGGLRGNQVSFFTNWYVWAGYTNVNAFSFHGGDMLYGPIDATLAYTNEGIGGVWWPTDSSLECIAAIYGKPFAVTEAYPFSPDVLGKTNSWWVTQAQLWAETNSLGVQVGYTSLPYTWQTMTFRFWKNLVEWRSTGVDHIQTWLQLWDNGVGLGSPPLGYEGEDAYAGWDWDANNGLLGCGPLPSVDGEAMVSWWLTGARPLTNWLSGSVLRVVDPLGGYTSGTPGLHFYTWVFTNATTNTFIWADEQTTVTTNFGVGLTDLFSNQWNGPIGIEPVIAWGWPKQ
ncbi:MAG: thrombospondin type 3 repeat-containing protein [Verrucomicrobiia bacterium]